MWKKADVTASLNCPGSSGTDWLVTGATTPHDRQAQLPDGAHKAVLTNILGRAKPIMTPIGMSELDFHFITYPPLSLPSFRKHKLAC